VVAKWISKITPVVEWSDSDGESSSVCMCWLVRSCLESYFKSFESIISVVCCKFAET
jgi:hypothetical protein